jgi:hypothetical protein
VHGAAVLRMRMADQRNALRHALLRFFEQRFQPAGWAGKKKTLDFTGHQLVR